MFLCNKKMFLYTAFMKMVFLFLISSLCHSHELKIELSKKRSNKGNIGIVVFNSDNGFPEAAEKAVYKKFIAAKEFPHTIDLPSGEYAISVFHDENENQKLDTNFISIPKESFGFSNNVLGLMGPPSFEKAKFQVMNTKNKVYIELKQF